MRKLQIQIGLLSLVFFTIGSTKVFSQPQKTSIEVDPKVEELLHTKRKMNASLTIDDSYKIQIYTGESGACEKERNIFKKEFKDYDSTIKYSSPNYKVYVGPFESRLEAEAALVKIREKYPTCFVIKPSK